MLHRPLIASVFMFISQLNVENFRAISTASLIGLQEMVVVAGPNGCGKSCILDAIRLLKSSYGAYQINEWQNWFSEFKINIDSRGNGISPDELFQDKTRELRIGLSLVLSQDELLFLRKNAKKLITRSLWAKNAAAQGGSEFGLGDPSLAYETRSKQPGIEICAEKESQEVLAELKNNTIRGELTIKPGSQDLQIKIHRCRTLELIFSTYDPKVLGIIDYHGAHRDYSREGIKGINLSFADAQDTLMQHALYNYRNKYSNIKSEMASSYVRGLLARESGAPMDSPEHSLSDVLKELFETFFPGKHFEGPRPTNDGLFEFMVKLDSGHSHDIDELSSGEKEVLYGYLRLRNSAPRNSILLLDEPELHLNPRLVSGLPAFYKKYLGKSLGNQIWLVTHSDTLLRESVSQPGFSVFHMHPTTEFGQTQNQALLLDAQEDVEKAVIDLVGDLAAYRPGAKVVIFEGGGDAEFDVRMTTRLFPKFSDKVNAISGGNKAGVRALQKTLHEASGKVELGARFYGIVDSDSDSPGVESESTQMHQWDVYHIENYLLSASDILEVLNDYNTSGDCGWSEDNIEQKLQSIAEETLDGLVYAQLQSKIGKELNSCISTKINPDSSQYSSELCKAVKDSSRKIAELAKSTLNEKSIGILERELRAKYSGDLKSGQWRKTFRGRDILKKFCGEYARGTKYEHFL